MGILVVLSLYILCLSIFGCESYGQVGGTFDTDVTVEAAVVTSGRGVEAGGQQRSLIGGRARGLGGRAGG